MLPRTNVRGSTTHARTLSGSHRPTPRHCPAATDPRPDTVRQPPTHARTLSDSHRPPPGHCPAAIDPRPDKSMQCPRIHASPTRVTYMSTVLHVLQPVHIVLHVSHPTSIVSHICLPSTSRVLLHDSRADYFRHVSYVSQLESHTCLMCL